MLKRFLIYSFFVFFLPNSLLLATPCPTIDGADKENLYLDGLRIPWQAAVSIDCAKFPEYNDYVLDEVLVLSSEFSEDEITYLLDQYDLRLERIDKIKSLGREILLANTKGVDARIKAGIIRRQEPHLEAQANLYYRIDNIEKTKNPEPFTFNFRTVPLPVEEYPLGMTGVPRLRTESDGEHAKICMIDTPIDINHPTLSPDRIEMSNDVSSNSAQSMRHGTAIASILVSQNRRVGIAPRAKLYAMGSFSHHPNQPSQSSTSNLIIRNLERCIENQADIINLSFAGPPDPAVTLMIRAALKHNILIVASAGNHGPNAKPAYPAAIPGVIAVTAVDAYRNLFTQANRGYYIDYAAPGVGILAAVPGRGFNNNHTGTSMATAHVSGVLALLISRFGHVDARRLASSAIDLGEQGKDPFFGYGLINP